MSVVWLGEPSTLRREALLQAGAVAQRIRARLSALFVFETARTGVRVAMIERRCPIGMGMALLDAFQADEAVVVAQADASRYRAEKSGAICFGSTTTRDRPESGLPPSPCRPCRGAGAGPRAAERCGHPPTGAAPTFRRISAQTRAIGSNDRIANAIPSAD